MIAINPSFPSFASLPFFRAPLIAVIAPKVRKNRTTSLLEYCLLKFHAFCISCFKNPILLEAAGAVPATVN
jgi:hypothetical protein